MELVAKDFALKDEIFSSNRKGKRQYLNETKTRRMIDRLNVYFQTRVSTPRIRMDQKQEIETVINEEAMLLSMYLRNEKTDWIPRIAITRDSV
jgi:ribosomal protein L28